MNSRSPSRTALLQFACPVHR